MDIEIPAHEWTKLRSNTLQVEQGMSALEAIAQAWREYQKLLQEA